MDEQFDDFFKQAAGGKKPRPWQIQLAAGQAGNRLIRIPTGFGKTLGVLAAWAYHRIHCKEDAWPRRLVWCLPMRVLVEQTEAEARAALADLGLLWDGAGSHEGKVGVHVLMGGVDAEPWHLYPEECAVLIGTQDMLLSRALNRGYASGRAKWPMEFGLLNQDALWVMDEAQLMDVGLATSAQLQACRDEDLGKSLRPCHTWWMSATLQLDWLRSVDTGEMLAALPGPQSVTAEDKQEGLWKVEKACCIAPVKDESEIAGLALAEHKKNPPNSLTLVVVNTVDAALAVHESLSKAAEVEGFDLRMAHSRYRPHERKGWRESFLGCGLELPSGGRIIVSTQVIEAGVDISAATLVTELAPWPSLVQRFGRCARYAGEKGRVVIADRGYAEGDEKVARPYELAQLVVAREKLKGLADASPASLEALEQGLSAHERKALYPYQPKHLLLRREWEELFDTSPDLSGADIDISRFIRSGEELDVLVFWRQIPEAGPLEDWEPGRDELCPLSFLKARDWLGKEKAGVAWVWDWLDGQWQRATERNIYPGRIVLVDAAAGGYSELAGWSKAHAGPVPLALGAKSSLVARADGSQSRDDISVSAWKTIATHGKETALLAEALARSLGLPDELTSLVGVAGMWHDVGKAHACFQGSMRLPDRPARQDLAKAPGVAWSKAWRYEAVDVPSDQRPGLRHELASVLAMFAALQKAAPGHPALSPKAWEFTGAAKPEPESTQGEPGMWVSQLAEIGSSLAFNLMAYLVASHHGKVRMRMQAHAKDQRYRDRDGRGLPICGVREGDRLAAVMGDGERPLVGELELSLELARLGLSDKTGPSWTERTLGLLAHYGPGPLALMEAVLRAADIRASQLDTADPLLPQEVRL